MTACGNFLPKHLLITFGAYADCADEALKSRVLFALASECGPRLPDFTPREVAALGGYPH